MEKGTRFVGLDVHKASIAVAVGGSSGDPEDHGQIPNDPGLRARQRNVPPAIAGLDRRAQARLGSTIDTARSSGGSARTRP